MGPVGEVLIGLTMAIGIIGTLIPVLPGLFLVWLAGLAWAILDGADTTHWIIFALMTVIFLIGFGLSLYIPAKSTKGESAPKWTFLVASVFALIGFFVIPIVGLPLGFIFGVFFCQLIAGREFHRALRATGTTLKAIGLVSLIHFACGIAIASAWAFGLLIVN
ncbi:MAG: DUF456 domain-containing protein [Actinobacteria bacterium]|nr:DUF456 domain-containing protein [Actinomycetota bacterium]